MDGEGNGSMIILVKRLIKSIHQTFKRLFEKPGKLADVPNVQPEPFAEAVNTTERVWQLRIPSGLKFKFNDPESLFSMGKKLPYYKGLHVSADGQNWVDFGLFISKYKELRDPDDAFFSCLAEK